MIIYVSIPITGTNIEDAKKKAESVKFMLYGRFVGSKVITPFDVCKETGKSYAYYMGKDVKALLESDSIYMCDLWQLSNGCKAEYEIAKIYGKEIIHE